MAARSLPSKKQTTGLPTPPNSISPSLPPQAYQNRGASDPLTPPAGAHVDSDIDLEDAVQHAKAQDSPQRGLTARRLGELAELDSVGSITPALLAKHHLPAILLDNGPLAIRHVMGHLTTSVPGFSGIPPAKARRLVVGALEGRGSDGQQGGLDGNVIFEKVGWGRWDARKRGQPSRDPHRSRQTYGSPAPRGSLRIPVHSTRRDRTRDVICGSHQSDHSYDTPMEDISMLEHEADKMSLDNASSCSESDARHNIPMDDDDLGDITDEEDWASIGAAALRQGSFPLTGGLMPRHTPNVDSKVRGRGLGGRPPPITAKSVPIGNGSMYNITQPQGVHAHASMGLSPLQDNDLGTQDREAVEALLKLSSV